jgi:hypothetical protein
VIVLVARDERVRLLTRDASDLRGLEDLIAIDG